MKITKNDKILITGGKGFLGSFVVEKFNEEGFKNIIVFSKSEYDLLKENEVSRLFKDFGNIDVVIHIAADIGGIGYSSEHPAQQFYNNVLMNTFIMHHAYLNKVKKFVGIGSVCEYPAETPIPFTEDYIWNGYPVISNDGYGLSKRFMLAQTITYKREYGFNSIHLVPINLYGPRDDFNLDSSHVIPAIIRKIFEAKDLGKKEIEIWGSGEVSREFLYVEDAAKGIFLATKFYNEVDPVNLGTGFEIKIKDLAILIKDLMEYKGILKFNKNKPEGQKRRQLDVSKAKERFDFSSEFSLSEGLNRTIDWYLKNKEN